MEETIKLEKEEMIYNVLSIGEVTKGDEASATITGKEPNQLLNLVLPKGDRGEAGPPGPPGPKGEPGSALNVNYSDVSNKPKINNKELSGNLTLEELGISINSKLKYFTIILNLDDWTLNEETNLYEYDIENTNINSNTLVLVKGNSVNADKFIRGETLSYNGGVKLMISKKPSSNVNATCYYCLVENNVVENNSDTFLDIDGDTEPINLNNVEIEGSE